MFAIGRHGRHRDRPFVTHEDISFAETTRLNCTSRFADHGVSIECITKMLGNPEHEVSWHFSIGDCTPKPYLIALRAPTLRQHIGFPPVEVSLVRKVKTRVPDMFGAWLVDTCRFL